MSKFKKTPERLLEINNDIISLYNRIQELEKERTELLKDTINLKGKFLQYTPMFDDDPKTYIYVTDTYKLGSSFIVQGHGFSFCYDDYPDNNYAKFDACHEITFTCDSANEFETYMKRFKEITEDEYLFRLKDMVDKLFSNVVSFINSRKDESPK